MQLKIGSKVSFLKETGGGILKQIKGNQVLVCDENGFENWHLHTDVAPIISIYSDSFEISESDPKYKDSNAVAIKRKKNSKEWKIDLHIENLVESSKNMTNHEILLYQMKCLNEFLEKAKQEKVAQIIVVHGIGSGKLKNEIKMLVSGMKGAEMHDANYQITGVGASIIERKYNVR